ncbi:unnamed protein product, partial [Rotaria sp. Silwood2]
MSSHADRDCLIDVSVLPKDIFSRINHEFYDVVKFVAGDLAVKILRIQMINSAGKLLNTPDVFAFLRIDSEEIDAIKIESCFKSKNGQFIIKPGIKSGVSYLVKLLQETLKEERELASNENNETHQKYINNDFIDKHPLLKSKIEWYQVNGLNNTNKTNAFLTSFIDNLISNCTRSPNHFRYDESIKKFAICLYVLDGKQVYEFIRLNLYESIPNLTTVCELINKSDAALSEAEFQFESLQQFHSRFAFCSEDTTEIIRKV